MGMSQFWQGMTTALQNPATLDIAQQTAGNIGAPIDEANASLMWSLANGDITPSSSPEQISNAIATNWQQNQASLNDDPLWDLMPLIAIGGPLLAGALAGGSLLGGAGLFGGGETASGLSPFFENAWAANNAAALNLGGAGASAVPGLNLLGAGASSLASTIPSLANALSVYGVTPIPSMDVYNAANMIGGQTSLWDQSKNFLKDNAGSIAKTASSMFQQPAGQAMPTMPDFSMGASGGTQPTQQRSIAQQQQSQPSQLSVPQFNQMPGPQQDYGNYQAPQYMDQSQGWGDPSVFQLSQSTWNPSMANALRSYNG